MIPLLKFYHRLVSGQVRQWYFFNKYGKLRLYCQRFRVKQPRNRSPALRTHAHSSKNLEIIGKNWAKTNTEQEYAAKEPRRNLLNKTPAQLAKLDSSPKQSQVLCLRLVLEVHEYDDVR